MFGKVMKQELRANSLLYGVASAIALLFAFATVMNRTRGTDVSYLVKASLLTKSLLFRSTTYMTELMQNPFCVMNPCMTDWLPAQAMATQLHSAVC